MDVEVVWPVGVLVSDAPDFRTVVVDDKVDAFHIHGLLVDLEAVEPEFTRRRAADIGAHHGDELRR